MLDFISGHVRHVEPVPVSWGRAVRHLLTLQARNPGGPSGTDRRFSLTITIDLQPGDEVLLMLHEGHVVGMHNCTTGIQVNVLRERGPFPLWRLKDFVQAGGIAVLAGLWLPEWTVATSLAWLVTAMGLRAWGSWCAVEEVDASLADAVS